MTDSADHLRTTRLLACAAMLLAACERAPPPPPPPEVFVRAPGAVPTHDQSFEVLARSPQERVAILHKVVSDAGNACAQPVRVTFEGGVDGTDEWTLACSTGEWTIWFKRGNVPEITPRKSKA